MFTGLIEDVGTIEHVVRTDAGREFRIRCRYDALELGESVAVNGACLTVREQGPGWFTVAAVSTTLERTAMGAWEEGRRVNLERAMRIGARLGGHLVLGHVDGVARVRQIEQREDAMVADLALPPGLSELMVLHGSVTVDGVSLTVNELPADDVVQISLIDYTLRHTTLGLLHDGMDVQVEADVIGKYVQRMMAPYRAHAL